MTFNDMVKKQRAGKPLTKAKGYYVDTNKSDGEGATLGGAYNGMIQSCDEAINEISDSLDLCGTNLTCFNAFPLSRYGDLKDYIEGCFERLDSGESEEEFIHFKIDVKITIGKHK